MADKSNASGSDSESSLTDWTVVDGHGDIEGSETSSTSSSLEFVQLEENACSAIFQRRESERHEHKWEENLEPNIAAEDEEPFDTQESIEDLGPQLIPDNAEQEVSSAERNDEAISSNDYNDVDTPLGGDDEDFDNNAPTTDQEPRVEVEEKEQNAAMARPEVPSSSDSDSDFVKLEPSSERGAVMNLPEVAANMETSSSSSRASSSISANFRFVHPLLPPNYQVYREASDEEDSLAGDVDDRCESDISGVADDDSIDSDMSGMNYCIGDIPLTAGRRLYKHSPNRSLNSVLTTVSLAAMFIAIGIGLGHYLGVSRESALRRMQVTKMKVAQDNHLMCLKHASIVKDQLTRMKDAARFANGGMDKNEQDFRTCGDMWRTKYENVMVQNSKLELRIQELEAENEAQTRSFLELIPCGCQHDSVLKETKDNADLQSYVKTVREDLNKAELENHDLRREVSRLRYSAHPANSILDPETREKEMKLKVNQLVTENSDLKSAVGKMRYSSYPNIEESNFENTVSESVPDVDIVPCNAWGVNVTQLQEELVEVNRQLAAERKLNIMLRLTLVRNTKQNGTESSTDGASALMKCYRLLGPEIINKTSDYIDMAKSSAAIYISMLANGTEERKQHISEKWKQIMDLWGRQNTGSIRQQLGKIKGEVTEFLALLTSATDEGNPSKAKSPINKTAAFLKNITRPVAAHFQDYMNKTKQTVSKLSSTLQETWQVVKNLSNDFIKQHSGKIDGVKENIMEKAKGVQRDIREKWQTVRGKMEKNGWLKKQREKAAHHKANHPREAKRSRGYQKQNHNTDYERREREGREYSSPLPGDSAKRFEDKPHHKQRQSNHEQYNEFWRKVDFDPDDYFHEGFFEGNQREWRKHQERLKHLHDRIHRLNEDILYSMDDDDIEDIYEDLDDLQDDMDDEDQPQILQTWLACQVRWWKSRLQRKHRSQDLVKGCGRQIMQWQLRALCKDECVGKRCSKKKYNLKYLPQCREVFESQDYYCLKKGRVIECHGREKNKDFQTTHSSPHKHTRTGSRKPADKRDNLPYPMRPQKTRDSEEELFTMSRPEQPDLDEDQVNSTQQWDQESEDNKPEFTAEPIEDAKDQPSEDEDSEDSSWLFERALVREYHHHNPDWHFRRAAQRDFERTKPWYVGRSEGRELLRLKHQEKQAD